MNRSRWNDNQEIDVYCKVNELAERWGLRAYDFLAVIEYPDERDPLYVALDFRTAPQDPRAALRFERKLDSLRVEGDDLRIHGTVQHIIDRLANALSVAPRRGRG